MNNMTSYLQQIGQLASQHAPENLVSHGVLAAFICLLGGMGVSVLGAKLSRPGITLCFILAGGFVGAEVARHADLSTPLCAAVGAAMIGTVAYLTHRLWVGVVMAGALALVALSVFGYTRVMPHISEFEQTAQSAPSPGVPFSLPTPEEQQAYRDRSVRDWADEFWTHVTSKDPTASRNAKAIGLVALVTGLFLGVVAMRATLIFSTSLLGTALVFSSFLALMARYLPNTHAGLIQRPNVLGITLVGFFATSVILQTLLTRKAASEKSECGSKS